MEPASNSKPWYGSSVALILATILFPPVGLILLWLRRDTETGQKVFGSVAIVALAAAYVYFYFSSGLFVIGHDPGTEAHYSELERQRAEQRESASDTPPAASSADQNTDAAVASANTNESKPAGPGSPPTSKSIRNYWTNFRGPNRDGHYDETRIRTDWPAEGLRLMWKQPIGGGYASFVVAEGMAFTIEQRRRQEIVAAYDVETGRELWIHGWDAEFREAMGGDGPRATPTWDAGRLYALGAEGDLICFEAKYGKVNWSKNIL